MFVVREVRLEGPGLQFAVQLEQKGEMVTIPLGYNILNQATSVLSDDPMIRRLAPNEPGTSRVVRPRGQ